MSAGGARPTDTEISMPTSPVLSLIVPTRRRPERLRTFLARVAETADDPKALEVVLVIDADDPESLTVASDRLTLRKVVVPPGRTMGELNAAGYEASAGRHLMLLNDDVLARTRGWDTRLRTCFADCPDGILLVHVNDTIFGKRLCTFPVVSRTFCELAGGICPRDYLRYRIDDHIEDVFNLLGLLGERRSIYLPDVVFEHTNLVEVPGGGLQYRSEETALAADAARFEALLPQRKELAVRLRRYIEECVAGAKEAAWRSRLEGVTESRGLRVPERLRVVSDSGLSSADTRVTVGLVTADGRRSEFRACLDALRAHTRNYELLVLDRQGAHGGGLGGERNRLLRAARTDHVVLLEEDALVGPDWLDGLLRCLTGRAALVTPPHRGRGGSPCLLLDRAKCPDLFFDETGGPFAAVDFGLRLREAGFEVACAAGVTVAHPAEGPRPHARLGGLFGVAAEKVRKARDYVRQVGYRGLMRILCHKAGRGLGRLWSRRRDPHPCTPAP